jgi:hypothetical protein
MYAPASDPRVGEGVAEKQAGVRAKYPIYMPHTPFLKVNPGLATSFPKTNVVMDYIYLDI